MKPHAPDAPPQARARTTAHLLRLDHHIAHVHLSGPNGNPVGLETLRELLAITDRLHGERTTRALVLTAAGHHFCFGADLRDPALAELVTSDPSALAVAGQRLLESWSSLPFPTVVGAQGRVIGAGAGLVVASDFRLLGDDAVLHFPEVERGMYLSWGLLPRLISAFGPSAARWLALACTPVRADDLPPLSVQRTPNPDLSVAAIALARSLATLPAEAARLTLQTLREQQPPPPSPSVDAGRFTQSIQHPSFAEAMQRWMQR